MKSNLENNQQALVIEKEKISLLKNKLFTLSEARSNKDMLRLMVAYAEEVKSELDTLQKDSNEAK